MVQIVTTAVWLVDNLFVSNFFQFNGLLADKLLSDVRQCKFQCILLLIQKIVTLLFYIMQLNFVVNTFGELVGTKINEAPSGTSCRNGWPSLIETLQIQREEVYATNNKQCMQLRRTTNKTTTHMVFSDCLIQHLLCQTITIRNSKQDQEGSPHSSRGTKRV